MIMQRTFICHLLRLVISVHDKLREMKESSLLLKVGVYYLIAKDEYKLNCGTESYFDDDLV